MKMWRWFSFYIRPLAEWMESFDWLHNWLFPTSAMEKPGLASDVCALFMDRGETSVNIQSDTKQFDWRSIQFCPRVIFRNLPEWKFSKLEAFSEDLHNNESFMQSASTKPALESQPRELICICVANTLNNPVIACPLHIHHWFSLLDEQQLCLAIEMTVTLCWFWLDLAEKLPCLLKCQSS